MTLGHDALKHNPDALDYLLEGLGAAAEVLNRLPFLWKHQISADAGALPLTMARNGDNDVYLLPLRLAERESVLCLETVPGVQIVWARERHEDVGSTQRAANRGIELVTGGKIVVDPYLNALPLEWREMYHQSFAKRLVPMAIGDEDQRVR